MATELISISALDGIVLKAMINLGYPEDEAHVIKDILMAAELRNNSQGISKLYDVSSPGSLKYNAEVLTSEEILWTQLKSITNSIH